MPGNLTAALQAMSSLTVVSGGTFTFRAGAVNFFGEAPTGGGSTSRIVLTNRSVFTPSSDIVLAEQVVPALGSGGDYQTEYTVTLNLAPGTYYLAGFADYYNQIAETNENDNNFNYLTVQVVSPIVANLTETVVAIGGTTAVAGGNFTFQARASNSGSGSTSGESTSRIFLSSDTTIDGNDTLLATQIVPTLLATGIVSQGFTVALPDNLRAGTYYIGGLADFYNQISETNESDNNNNFLAITVTEPPRSNLTETVVAIGGTTAVAGGSFTFQARASNSGAASTGGESTSRIFLSSDTIIDGNDTLLATQIVPTLLATGTTSQGFTVTMPDNLRAGTYYIGGIADFYGQITETNEGDNNNNFLAITVTEPPRSNLTETVVAVSSTTVAAGGSFTFQGRASNSGAASASSGSTSRIFLSDHPFFTSGDTVLATHIVPTLLATGIHSQGFTWNVPIDLAPGTYYIGGFADAFEQVIESNEFDNNNNVLAVTVTAPLRPNLTETVTALTSTTVTPGGSFSFAARASNSGTASTGGGSTSRIFLAADPAIFGSETLLAIHTVPTLAQNLESAENFTVNLPTNLAPGTYYIGGLADFHGQVFESNEFDNNNNTVAVTVLPSNLTETVTALSSTSMSSGASFSFQARASNIGTGNSFASTSGIYLSDDATITTSDVLLVTRSAPILTPGAIASQDFTLTLPSLRPGTYYIGGVADIADQVRESNELDNNNNFIAITITGSNEVSGSFQEEGGRCVALTMDEANSQLSQSIAGMFAEMAGWLPADPSVHGSGEVASSAPLAPTPDWLKYV